jgi:hypothetical protein
MPIKLNLLAEVQAQEEMRRKDPVKFATFLGALLVVISLVWFSASFATLKLTESKLNVVKAEIATKTNEFAAVKLNQTKITECRKRQEELEKLNSARLLQGPLLDGLQQIYVANVAIIRTRLDQTFVLKEGLQTKVGRTPSSTVEKTLLTIDAKDYSTNPGDQINRFKDSFVKSEYFKSVLETNGVRLAGSPSAPQTGADGKVFVQFTLECRYPEKTR